ncbi:transcriptional regulator TrmB protein [Halorhabdus tiamatea SARL4B]|uniref:Archaeal sugar-specific transcriptional regulator, TrmB family n=1 Tax=Halorhabdus tiamatea SARL4B TaxID=1033806 RepID=F7PFP6_9EURY|nr:TrmB family transcriptional regulator [Halorhabdus tiamatea]ERJ05151.1 transcriptional regulator TrmB protein [Halorhabdus tiamatea SARL4B]CCQ32296.1 archaeal sugar-specific transcriptional regulator, TrmB family [Halorhabdus tiamatea SARL4B]
MTESDDSALARQLAHFGLSDTEIQTYLAVLENGEAKASTIADATGVSKRYVYSVCEELEDQGFVEVNDHVVPTKIRAKRPEDVIEILSNRLEEIEPALERRFSAAETRPQRFDVIKSRVTVVKRINEYISEAEYRVAISIPHSTLPQVREALQDAVERGVLVLLLVTDTDTDGSEFAEYDRPVASAIRSWNVPIPVMIAVDRELGVISSSEMMTVANSDERAISLAQKRIVPTLFGSFLANFWLSADEVYVIEPAPLGRTYESIEHAVFQATLQLRAGNSVTARVEATSNADHEATETVTGRVLETNQGIAEPVTNEFPIEHSLVLETDEGRTTIGGHGAFLEEYAARTITLEDAE